MTENLKSAINVATGQPGRVAIYIRLSRETAESASIETQRTAARTWLVQNGHDTSDVVEYVDAGVSGAKPLEERKHMRALMASRPSVIIAWKLDRYARSVSEFLRLVAWGEAHNVRIATTDNTINTATPTGRMVAVVLAALAEWERSLITGRILDGQATRRTQGRWISGAAPYGFQIERRDGAAYLVHNGPEAERIREAVDSLIAEGSLATVASTARMLGIGERQWRRMLTNGILRGHFSHQGKLVLAEDGITPVQFTDPLINAAEAKRIRERLNDLAVGKERAPRQATPLVTNGMGTCHKCSANLNGGKRRDGVPRYRCKTGCSTITASHLDERIEDEFLTRWGGFAEHVVRFEGGNDLSDQMIEAQEQAERLTARMASAGPLMLASLEKHAAELEAAYAALRAAHDPDVREVLVPTGRTLGEAWEAADRQGRTKLLGDVGLHVVLWPKTRADRLEITWAIGGDDHALAEMIGDMDWSANA
jgi:DNA invertase Pin-like site-specific DNA recombinase